MLLIEKYFPTLTPIQLEQFGRLQELYTEWNEKINVISRKDIENLYLNHVLHSLSIAKFIHFKEGSKIFDLGTGGGFPGIPMAILFPEVTFKMVDARGKKISVVNAVIESLGLQNANAFHQRVEDERGKYDFVITRAVAQIDQLWQWSAPLIAPKHINALPNGLIALKGGNIDAECKSLPKKGFYDKEHISQYFKESYFEEKYVVYVN